MNDLLFMVLLMVKINWRGATISVVDIIIFAAYNSHGQNIP